MRIEEHRITVAPEIEVSSVWAWPDEFRPGISSALILAHGAGSSMQHPLLTFVHQAVALHGVMTVKFNFPYMDAGRKAPDPPPLLLRTWRAVIAQVRSTANPGWLCIGGRSMGGRIASMVAAEGTAVDGLVLLAYPLQPASRPGVVRADHFPRIACPLLFVQGSRDKLCDLDLLRTALKKLSAPVTLHVIEEGDHSFKVPKRAGRSERQVWEEIVAAIESWMPRRRPGGCA